MAGAEPARTGCRHGAGSRHRVPGCAQRWLLGVVSVNETVCVSPLSCPRGGIRTPSGGMAGAHRNAGVGPVGGTLLIERDFSEAEGMWGLSPWPWRPSLSTGGCGTRRSRGGVPEMDRVCPKAHKHQ